MLFRQGAMRKWYGLADTGIFAAPPDHGASSMDVRRLKYFIVTAEERSISRAAERLHITQPPLTRHIQSLEEELGARLFTRTNSGVELTQAGTALLDHARNINAHVELATEQVRRVAAGQAGRIDIGVCAGGDAG